MEVCLKIFCCGEKGETRKNAMSYILGWMIRKAPMTMIEWWLSPMKFCNAFSLMQNIKNNPWKFQCWNQCSKYSQCSSRHSAVIKEWKHFHSFDEQWSKQGGWKLCQTQEDHSWSIFCSQSLFCFLSREKWIPCWLGWLTQSQ